jgi:16S rRNA (cytosine1402-N4)-methyltransferase
VTTPPAHHTPVLCDRVFALLAPALTHPGAVFVDATVGLGGHSEYALSKFPDLTVIGIDRDARALDLSRGRLEPWGMRVRLVHAIYDELPRVLADVGLTSVDGILFDLGVSSMQLDDRERGFAYSIDAPLDMRMSTNEDRSAADIVNGYSEGELARILREFGEERFASRIARGIVRARASQPVTSSAQLVDIIREAIPAAARRTGGNPAKRTFQALRIEVNGELEILRAAIPAALDVLSIGGRLVALSYQSLEDRIVKQEFTRRTRLDVPPDLPIVPEGSEPSFRLLVRGSQSADESEVADNPRAASVRLRAIERIAA